VLVSRLIKAETFEFGIGNISTKGFFQLLGFFDLKLCRSRCNAGLVQQGTVTIHAVLLGSHQKQPAKTIQTFCQRTTDFALCEKKWANAYCLVNKGI